MSTTAAKITACIALLAGIACSGVESPPGAGDHSGGGGDKNLDSIPPARIKDLSLAYDTTSNSTYLEWIAPSDDSLGERVAQYDIRYTLGAPFVWEKAVSVVDPPLPTAPGTRQSYEFKFFGYCETLRVAIRSRDEAGNESALSPVDSLRIPGLDFKAVCLAIFTDEPVPGLEVEFSAGDTMLVTTGADGSFEVRDVPPQQVGVHISYAESAMVYHDIVYTQDLIKPVDRVFYMIPVSFTELNPYMSTLAFFRRATEWCRAQPRSILVKWARFPVDTYIPSFVNDNGVDYGGAARTAAERWMTKTGVELFTFVDTPPDEGISVNFKAREEMGGLVGITRHTYGPNGLPLRDDIDVVNDFQDEHEIYKILLHEFGHTIRLCHLSSNLYIMYGGHPLPDDISNDEANVVRMLIALPNRTDMSMYIDVHR